MSNETTETSALDFKRMGGPIPGWEAESGNYSVSVSDATWREGGGFLVTVEWPCEGYRVGTFSRKTLGGAMRAATRILNEQSSSRSYLNWLPRDFMWTESWLLDWPKMG